jgi:hypothetical protein
VHIDCDLKIYNFNKDYLDFFHVHRNDLIGISILDFPLIPNEERTAIASAMEDVLRSRIPHLQCNHSFMGQKTIWTRWKSYPVIDDKERGTSIVSFGQVAERRRADGRNGQCLR